MLTDIVFALLLWYSGIRDTARTGTRVIIFVPWKLQQYFSPKRCYSP